MHALLLFSLIVGCEKPTTIDEACPKRTPGENKVSAEAAETLQRINCYRKLAGLSSGKAHPAVTEVSKAHVAYMEANGFDASMFSSDLWMAEEPTAEGFTGEDIWKRLHYKGFKSDNSLEFGAWLLGAISPLRRSAMVDYWVQEPKVREMFLQPGWRGAGYAELPAPGESKNQMYYTELDVVYRFPSSAHSAQPIVYPVHNQVDVPTQISTFGALTDYDTELEHVGYPITVTVSSAESDVVSYDEP
ncbi:MAG: hypothetical protein HN348_32555, partial [Proteobacteria bacterium]|nr:hypothetical protein [Pseudomonadota bacterium]